ncbi:MAG: nucleoside phosphorylase [Rikenellaceae bacterium]|nr:nucleoside phosphorylase [Rikenellaceae bacterium]
MKRIEESELIINEDGSVFHLHLKPEYIADRIILVGDPDRVNTVSRYFDSVEVRVSNREFSTVTGSYKGTRLSVLSTGIGTDNIDIVVTELDALVNIDFTNRTVKQDKKSLYMVRLGTSGALHENIPLGANIIAEISSGFDGLLNFYADSDKVCDKVIEKEFTERMNWNPRFAAPYFIRSSEFLNSLFGDEFIRGITVSAPGFYGPQGRVVRLALTDEAVNEKLREFTYNGMRINNYEMESSALAGLAVMLGHHATTVCTVIAQRTAKQSKTDYRPFVEKLIGTALDKLVSF